MRRYILAFIIMDKCKLRKPDEKKGASDIEEQVSASSPHEYVKKNIFSKACKVCGEVCIFNFVTSICLWKQSVMDTSRRRLAFGLHVFLLF